MRPWAGKPLEDGGVRCRALFHGEPRGHRWDGTPLQQDEFLIECEDGAYPDKMALSTPEYRARRQAELATLEAPPWAADLKAMEERIMKAIESKR